MKRAYVASMAAIILFCFINNDSAAKTIRALFLGNSYTQVNNLPELIKQLALSAGDTLEYSSNTPGGYTLEGHVSNAASISLIASGNWDFVILQEQSQRPSFPDAQVAADVYPYAEILNSMIKTHNPCAVTLFYVTWGRKNGDAGNCPFFPPLCTYEGMDSLLQLRYTIMAEENNASLCPVAMVWREIRAASPGIELYDSDESHPSSRGSYAAACAFYTMMFQKNPVMCTYNFTVPVSDAIIIKETVKQVVYDSLSFWNRFSESPLAAFEYSCTDMTASFINLSENADSYFWSFGDGNTSTDAAPVHTYTAFGAYEVKLTAQRGDCESITITPLLLAPTGTEEQNILADIVLYPNPVVSILNVHLQEFSDYRWSIVDVNGKIANSGTFRGQFFNVNMDRLPKGIYYLLIHNEHHQKQLYKKVIKE